MTALRDRAFCEEGHDERAHRTNASRFGGRCGAKQNRPSTKIIRISGGAALFIRAGSGTLGKISRRCKLWLCQRDYNHQNAVQHHQDQPGMMAPANKSPTEIDLGLKMPARAETVGTRSR